MVNETNNNAPTSNAKYFNLIGEKEMPTISDSNI